MAGQEFADDPGLGLSVALTILFREVFCMSSYILEALNLYYQYADGSSALQGMNMAIKRNSKTTLLGANGAGKTTFFLHCNGLLKPDSGKLKYAGCDFNYSRTYLRELKKKVGIVFQNPDSQLFSASVRQDISFGLMNLGFSNREALLRIDKIGEELGISELFDKATHFLSMGQKKLVALAGVLVMEPEIIICDEPTAGLDAANSKILLTALEQQYKKGSTIIISTHDVDLAYSWSDTVFIIDKGQVLEQGSPQSVLNNQAVLTKTHLQKPWISAVWEELQKASRPEAALTVPTNREELLQMMTEINKSQ